MPPLRELFSGKSSLSTLLRLLGLVLGCLVVFPAQAVPAPAEEEVKAVFLFNFASFIRWSETPARRATGDFRYCIHDEHLAALLARVVKGETVDGKPMTVVTHEDGRSLAECHVLYLADYSGKINHDLLERALQAKVLTVGNDVDFIEQGGTIALAPRRGRIHPVIHLERARQAGLRISSKLLSLSTLSGDKGSDRP